MKILIALVALSGFASSFVRADALGPVPVPKRNPMTADKIVLGKALYFDPRLSASGTVSCNSCHNVMHNGTDSLPTSLGVGAQKGGRNAPTVWNSAFLSVQFWDGRAPSLEEQAKGPIINPIEMAMTSHDLVLERIRAIPGYPPLFAKAFGNSRINIDQVADAIATYERTLTTPNSPYDRFVKGNKSAMSAQAIRGLQRVQSVGCVACHNGVNFAGPALPEGTGFFQKFPTFPSEYDAKYRLTEDGGRFEATKKPEDRGFWRVPTWRNVARTAPYFHNGSVATLDEAVRVMAKTQLNKTLEEDEVADITAFLTALNGEFPKQELPRLPE